MQAPEGRSTGLFSFMNPLALEIWLYILIAYVLVSITIWIVARLVRGCMRIPDGYLSNKRILLMLYPLPDFLPMSGLTRTLARTPEVLSIRMTSPFQIVFGSQLEPLCNRGKSMFRFQSLSYRSCLERLKKS